MAQEDFLVQGQEYRGMQQSSGGGYQERQHLLEFGGEGEHQYPMHQGQNFVSKLQNPSRL